MAAEPSPEDFKYWAFISYSHSDDKWAEWLHKELETYPVPKHLVGKPSREGMVPARAFPVFRDRDELPGSANLGDNLAAALRLSRYLIVICSPRAVQSKWVEKEIRMFKSWGREDRVLCLVVEGEPNATGRNENLPECLPAPVRFWVDGDGNLTELPTEPIAADARKGKDGKRNALLKLLAGVLGVNYADLRQREVERKEKQFKLAFAFVFALLLVFSCLGVAFYFQKNEAVNARKVAESERESAKRAEDLEKQAAAEARAAFAQERKAKEDAEAARQAAVKSAEAEHQAKIKAEDAQKEEAKARLEADDARAIAVRQQQELQQTLSRSDLAAAAKLIDEHSDGKALAYLSRALRYDAENPAVAARAISLLSQRNWPWPALEPLLHDEEVRSVVFSPTGQWVATVAENKVSLWNTRTGVLALPPLKHSKKINAAEFSPDGQWLVTASDDQTAQIWKTSTGEKKGGTLLHQDAVMGAVFSSDGKWVGTASMDKTVRIWDTVTGQPVGNGLLHDRPVQTVAFSPDGKTVATASANNVQLWDWAAGKLMGLPMKHDGGVYGVSFSPNGRMLATGSGDRAARIWDATTGVPVGQPMRHENWVFNVRFSPDSQQLLTASSDKTARLWDAATSQPLLTFPHDSAVNTAYFSPNGRWVVTASADGTARVWNAVTGEPITEPLRHLGVVHEARFSPDGKSVATASADRTVKLWRVHNGKPVTQIFAHEQAVNGALFTPDGKRLVTISSDRTARIWDAISGQPLFDPLKHKRAVTLLAISPNGELLATAAEDFTTQIWDLGTGKLRFSSPLEHDGAITIMQFSPDSRQLLTASDDRRARVWNMTTGKLAAEPFKHDGEIKTACLSPDGQWVVTGSSDKSARVWALAKGQLAFTLPHQGGVRSVSISPDNQWIVTGSEDRTAQVWSLATGKPLREAIPHDGPVQFVVFSPAAIWPEHHWILTASETTARLWEADSGKAVTEPIKPGELIRAACFSPNGYFLALGFNQTARIWDTSGKSVADAFTHNGIIRSVTFSPDGKFLLTASHDRSAKQWFFTLPSSVPAWFPELASAIGGYHLDDFGAAELVADTWAKMTQASISLAQTATPNLYSQWGKWFVTDRSTRTIAPFLTTPVSTHIRQLVLSGTENALADALALEPNHGLALVKMARLSKDLPKADYLSHLAENYEPENPEVLWERAQILQQVNRDNAALAVMERAIQAEPKNISVFGPPGTEFTSANQEGTLSKGWLPLGWNDVSRASIVNVSYIPLAESPKTGLTSLEIVVDAASRGAAELSGPRFLCRRNARCVVEGWVRSKGKSSLTVTVSQIIDARQKYKEQVVHGTEEWKPFKMLFNPVQDIAAELRISVSSGTSIQISGITVQNE